MLLESYDNLSTNNTFVDIILHCTITSNQYLYLFLRLWSYPAAIKVLIQHQKTFVEFDFHVYYIVPTHYLDQIPDIKLAYGNLNVVTGCEDSYNTPTYTVIHF